MGVDFTWRERRALYSLLETGSSDIVLKTDRGGFVVHASPALQQLGHVLPHVLIGPHLAELAQAGQREALCAAHRAALMGFDLDEWIEFRAAGGEQRGKWFEIRLRCLRCEDNRIAGTLGLIRNIDERKALEDKVFAAEMTCPLTGLTNRKALVAMLGHLIGEREPGCMALVSVDYLKAINLRHGQAVGDEVLVAFAEFLRAMMRPEDIVSRFGGQSLAVLFPGTAQDRAEALCQAMIETLARLGFAPPGAIPVTASAGVTPIGPSLDETIKRAELALFAARAKGRNRIETTEKPLSWAASRATPQAI